MTTGGEAVEMVWVEDRRWDTPSLYQKCRRGSWCHNPPVADLKRRRSHGWAWWAYCADHLYGRKLINGKVMIQVRLGSRSALRGYSE